MVKMKGSGAKIRSGLSPNFAGINFFSLLRQGLMDPRLASNSLHSRGDLDFLVLLHLPPSAGITSSHLILCNRTQGFGHC